jgi:hypothetical protein
MLVQLNHLEIVPMSLKTIQCRLVAPAETRQALWHLMAEQNTPLINELIDQVIHHPDFETWQQRGNHPTAIVSALCQTLRTEAPFSGQPSRFYASAINTTNDIFKSWLKLQKRGQNRLLGKRRWLDILKSDDELADLSGKDLTALQKKATTLLNQLKKTLAATDSLNADTLRQRLFQKYNQAKNPLTQAAIAYLLKHHGKIPAAPEDPDKFAHRRHKAEVAVRRLEDQLESRLPKGRDLTGQAWLDALLLAAHTVPKDNQEHKRWQDRLLTHPHTVPYPVTFETNEDLVWHQNEQGRLCVHFNGLSDHPFKIYCDQRQLPWFKRFLEDQTTKRMGKNQHSSSLFTLRSARLAWTPAPSGTGAPWQAHHLTLFCTVETGLWGQEGTDQVRTQREQAVATKIQKMEEKETLSATQQNYLQRLNSTRDRLKGPYDRPSRPLHQGQSHIIVGLSFGLDQPVNLAVYNALTQTVIAYRSVKQLLGKDYPLLTRHRQQQQHRAHQRHKYQKRSTAQQPGTSNLGQHIDRLLAKAIVRTAKAYQAGSIALPVTQNLREVLNAEIQARAEQKIPGAVEAQQRYAKQYRTAIHQWSYRRLSAAIASKARQHNLVIEEVQQSFQPDAKAMAATLAAIAYETRLEKLAETGS